MPKTGAADEAAIRDAERADRDAEPRIRVVDRRWWVDQEARDTAAEAPSLKPTYIEELDRQLAEKDRLLQEYITRYRDAAREFDEARLRLRREGGRDAERGRRALLAELLEVVDNLDRAVEAGQKSAPGQTDALLQGVELVRTQFLGKLEGFGVTRLDAVGQTFDPERHQAVSMVATDDPAKDQIVVGIARVGYMIGDELLRPAHVAVAQLTPRTAPTSVPDGS